MYIVKISNNGIETPIHNEREKLNSGKVVKGINTIDSFTFSMLPSNAGFDLVNEFTTFASVYNTNRKRYEFIGRVLRPETSMSQNGLIEKDITCESVFGYLCDSQQPYVSTQNWTVRGLLQHLINNHNSQVESYKHFVIGEVTVTDPNDNLYLGIQRENTWNAIKKNLIDKLGGELRYRVENGVLYIDYLEKLGETRSTAIEMSVNMKSITREKDPTDYVTRLIPLGAKLSNNTEERLDITSVNDGKNYIDDETAIEVYGIHVGYVTFDDVTLASNLLSKARAWMAENNRVQIKYKVTALDLSLIGKSIDDFDVGDYHPIKNPLLGIDDTARIVKKTIDVCEEVKSSFEMGDNLKTLNDIRIEQLKQVANEAPALLTMQKEVAQAQSNINSLQSQVTEQHSTILVDTEAIIMGALESYVKTSNYEEFKQTVSTQLAVMSDEILLNFATTTEQITEVDGSLQSKFTELYKYISFKGGCATFGDSVTAITLSINNGMIEFANNGVVFGSWDGDNFYTGNIVIRVSERAQFGNFAFIPRSDESLMLLKVGG